MSNPVEIFYVEDDVAIAESVKEFFEQLHYKVTIKNAYRTSNQSVWWPCFIKFNRIKKLPLFKCVEHSVVGRGVLVSGGNGKLHLTYHKAVIRL